MDLQALRERTRPEHEATEELLPLMKEGLTRAEYAEALGKLYPILRGWELWSAGRAPARFRMLLAARQRSGLLRQDLEHLAESGERSLPEVLPAKIFEAVLMSTEEAAELGAGHPAGSLAEIEEARFAGAMYVVEGSTLGGQYIAKHVEETFGLEPGQGDAYFRGYGAHTGEMWREVRGVLGELPDAWLEETVEGARRTFALFAAALRAEPR